MQHVLICTLFRDSEFYLDIFLGCMGKMIDHSKEYDIDLCFIEGNSIDNTYQKLENWMRSHKYSCALYKQDINTEMTKYERLAILRNAALDSMLKDYHDYAMMIDSDTNFTPDLLHRLVQSLERTDGAVMAPAIYVENTEFFHDILAFAKDGVNFVNIYPYHEAFQQSSGIMEMDSVGDCSLVRAGHITRFEGGVESEQIGFCRNIRKKGGKVYMDKRIAVYHADLPRYGLQWHKI